MIFFFNDTATTEIYTLSLHDALPIYPTSRRRHTRLLGDRKSTRLNSSHPTISYAVFCLDRKRDRKSTRLNSSHPTISYAVFCVQKQQEKISIRKRSYDSPFGVPDTQSPMGA